MEDFSACNLNKLALLIATVTGSLHVQIVQLRRPHP